MKATGETHATKIQWSLLKYKCETLTTDQMGKQKRCGGFRKKTLCFLAQKNSESNYPRLTL
ncbi:hypothetical protein C9994_10470 [Marivirga lumbricoides]|uniref:Uncharacterized protein n=1 Tax=Marivirga lumbricoides TaxID=1046115 RepID=A0A2T4DPP6_9BACT|nr:hypothetical protein C9994_10470 [Marivirga lumbricoides]